MAQLSRTILAGTAAINRAAEDLTRARQAKTDRERAALRAVSAAGDSLKENMKGYADMRERARAEKEVTQFTEAYNLGVQSDPNGGGLAALRAQAPKTRAGAEHLARLEARVTSRMRATTQQRLADASVSRESRLNKEYTDELARTQSDRERLDKLLEMPVPDGVDEQAYKAILAGAVATGDIGPVQRFLASERVHRTAELNAGARIKAIDARGKAQERVEGVRQKGKMDLQDDKQEHDATEGAKDRAQKDRHHGDDMAHKGRVLDHQRSVAENAHTVRSRAQEADAHYKNALVAYQMGRLELSAIEAEAKAEQERLKRALHVSAQKEWMSEEGGKELQDSLNAAKAANDQRVAQLRNIAKNARGIDLPAQDRRSPPAEAMGGGGVRESGPTYPPQVTTERAKKMWDEMSEADKSDFLRRVGGK